MSTSIHVGHRERLRIRFQEEGLDGFEDHQVLELLLFHAVPRGDTNPSAHFLLKRFGTLSAVLEADPLDVASVTGVGPRAAAFLHMLPQVARRYAADRLRHGRAQLTTCHWCTRTRIRRLVPECTAL